VTSPDGGAGQAGSGGVKDAGGSFDGSAGDAGKAGASGGKGGQAGMAGKAGDGGSDGGLANGCIRAPELDNNCVPGPGANAYRCITPYKPPSPNCRVIIVGNVTDIACCP
jgi:hypothetical protein